MSLPNNEIQLIQQQRFELKMENDIEIEELAKLNQEKEEKLRRMKSNIEKLQINMNKKISSKSNPTPKEPTTIYNHFQKQYSSTSPISTDKEFLFNSNLYKNITNDSQPIMENGSAVSNFSSVSNINQLLNGRFQQDRTVPAESKLYQKPKFQNNLLSDIDRLLEKSKNSKKMPIKAFEKFLDIKESKNFSEIEQLESSRLSQKKKEDISTKTKLHEYRRLIEKLDTIPEHKGGSNQQMKLSKFPKYDRHNSSDMSQQSASVKQTFISSHKKNQPSYTTNKSEYDRFPPLPSTRSNPPNPVERHKALIKESFQQLKKLSTEMSNQNLDKSQVDLQLSDDQSHEDKKENERKIEMLLGQKKELAGQLQRIECLLEQLQNSL